jgi:hypothetical protein
MASYGYINDFGSLVIIDDSNTAGGYVKKAQSLVGNTDMVINRFVQLPNGTKVNFDGTGSATTMPGDNVKQRVSVNDSSAQFYDAASALVGTRDTVTKYVWADGTTETCTGILKEVRILPRSRPALDFGVFELIFNLESDWA